MTGKSYDVFCEQYPDAVREYEEWHRDNHGASDDEHIAKIEEIKDKYGIRSPWGWDPITRPLKK